VLPPGVARRQPLSILPLLVLFEVAHRELGQHDGSPRFLISGGSGFWSGHLYQRMPS
jgi:hypothetical protein